MLSIITLLLVVFIPAVVFFPIFAIIYARVIDGDKRPIWDILKEF